MTLLDVPILIEGNEEIMTTKDIPTAGKANRI